MEQTLVELDVRGTYGHHQGAVAGVERVGMVSQRVSHHIGERVEVALLEALPLLGGDERGVARLRPLCQQPVGVHDCLAGVTGAPSRRGVSARARSPRWA